MKRKPELSAKAPLFTPGRAFALLAGYFLLQTLSRVAVSNSAELDESEQLLWSQAWAWGYGSDPPLYTWLQILTFRCLGTNILALALLKNVFLFGAFYFTFRAALALTADRQIATLAMLSLLLFPQITWESERDLTHSVLAAALAPATLYALAKVEHKPRARNYLLLGLCLGLGTLSKYSYCLFALALLGAAATVPRFRHVLASKWLLLTLLAAALITAPHLVWVWHRPALAFSRPEELMEASGHWHLAGVAEGLWSIVKCSIMLVGLLAVVYLICFRAGRSKSATTADDRSQLLSRTLGIVSLFCLAIVLGLAMKLKDRWFQPLTFLLAIWAALWARDRATSRGARTFLAVIGAVIVAMVLVLPGIPLMAGKSNRPTRLNAPYSKLAQQLKASAGNPPLILADTRLTGGNLRLWFTNSTVIAPEFQSLPIPAQGSCLVVWDANKKTSPSDSLLELVKQVRGTNLPLANAAFISASLKYAPRKMMRLGYVLLGSR